METKPSLPFHLAKGSFFHRFPLWMITLFGLFISFNLIFCQQASASDFRFIEVCDAGENWKSQTGVEPNNWVSVAYGNGVDYAIMLRAVNAISSGDASQSVQATIPNPTPPIAPASVMASGGDSLVDLTFTMEDDGGSPILNYEYSLNGGEWTAFDPVFLSSPVTITGLVNGTEYSIALRAINAVGAGEASQAVTAVPVACDAGENWKAYSAAFNGSWQSISYGNGSFVALAQNGQLISSEDGENWSLAQVTGADISNDFWRVVTFGNGKFVAISFGNKVISSTDGITWNLHTAAANRFWSSVTFGNGKFVAIGAQDYSDFSLAPTQVMSSTDGINWTAHAAATVDNWSSVVFGNGRFLSFSSTQVMSSIDGINWTIVETSGDTGWGSTVYGNGRFVSVGTNKTLTSIDGVQWTSSEIEGFWGSVVYGNGKFLAVASFGTNRVMSSKDGINWTIQQAAEDSGWSSITFGQGKFVSIARFSDRVMTSECSPPASVPSAPTDLIASVSDGLADISFTQGSDGGSSILNYEYSLDGGAWTPFETSPLMLNGLVNGQDYSITLRAINSVGVSDASEVLTFSPTDDCFAGQYWSSYATSDQSGWFGLTYGNGKYVAVSRFGTNRIMSSTDGVNWTNHNAPELNLWNSVTYGHGKFVAVAFSGTNRVMSSRDGISWTPHAVLQDEWRSVTYGNGRFVAVATSGSNRIMSSTDGITWTNHQAPELNSWSSVTYGNGKFVAVGSSGSNRVMVSTDGINWTAHPAAGQSFWSSVTFGNGKFVAVASSGDVQLMSSFDGITWEAHTPTEPVSWRSVAYGLGRFVVIASNSTSVMSSIDGVNWFPSKTTDPNGWFSITYGKGKFVAVAFSGSNQVMVSECTPPPTLPAAPSDLIASVSDGLADISFTQGSDGGSSILNYEYSLDGGAWTPFETSPLMLNGLVNGQDYSITLRAINSVGVSEASEVLTFSPTDDCFAGQYWTAYPAAANNFWRSITYGNGRFVAVSSDGQNRVMSSSDGINWTASPATEFNSWNSVTFGNGRFVAVSRDGANRVMSSTDGISWISGTGTNINTSTWNAVTYGKGRFVAVAAGGTNRIMSSTDGVNWTIHQAPGTNTWWSVTYGNGTFVAVGSNSVMISSDGINWTLQQAAANSSWFSITYGSGKFVAVSIGGEKKVMSSLDGVYWESHDTPGETNFWNSVTYGLGRFIATGQDFVNGLIRVMSSPDGVNWIAYKATEPNAWFTVGYGAGKFVSLAGSGNNRVMVSNCAIPNVELKAPTNIIIYPDDSKLEIEFTPPYDGVIPISNYEYSLDGGNAWITLDPASTASTLTITGLVNNTEYSISIRAVNSEGPGLSSVPVTAKPEACFVGKVWDPKSAVGSSDWTSVIYAKGKFVAVADYGDNIRSMTSTDGYTWTAGQAPLGEWSSVTFGKDKFVAVAYDGSQRVMSSPDGVNWTAHQAVENNFWNSVTFGQDKFVAVAASGTNRVMTSEDGVNWTGHQVPQFAWRSVTYDGKGRFVAVGENSVMSSSDGINWTIHNSPENSRWFSVAYGNGKFVAVAQTGTKRVMTSLDGMSWTAHEGNATNNWTSVSYGGGRFVAVSSSGNVMSSEDGITWVYPRTILQNQWYAVTYGDNKFVALSWYTFGVANQVITSDCPDSSLPDFEEIAETLTLNSGARTAWGDIDGDGDLDIVVVQRNSSGKVFLNDGSGNFTEGATGFPPISGAASITLVDIDKDGDLDVFLVGEITGLPETNKLFLNNGSGQFSDSRSLNIDNVFSPSVSWGDFDNDGDLDLLLLGDLDWYDDFSDYRIASTYIYRNDGGLEFTKMDVAELSDTGIHQLYNGAGNWVDYNQDGNLDFVISGFKISESDPYSSASTPATFIYKNLGNGKFEELDVNIVGVQYGSLDWSDFDGDGDLDLLIAGTAVNTTARIYRNEGNDTFTEINPGFDGVNGMAKWGDYDNDGDPDILVSGVYFQGFANTGRITKVFKNESGTFTELNMELSGLSLSIGGWADMDGDGDLDWMVSGFELGNVPALKVFKNNHLEKGGNPNTMPTAPLNLISTPNPAEQQMRLEWEAASDFETPVNSLSYNLFIREVGSENYSKAAEALESDGWRLVPTLGNASLNRFFDWNYSEADKGKTFEWSVQAIDGAFAGGEFAESGFFTLDNTPPSLVNQSGTFDTDTSRDFSLDDLSADDDETPADQLVFSIKSLPIAGILGFEGEEVEIGQTFTQADIEAGKLSYENKDNTAKTDSFTFTVMDLFLNETEEEIFSIILNDVTPPVALAQNVTVILGSNGRGTTSAGEVNAGSYDNFTVSGDLILSLDRTSFTCSDLGGDLTVTLTVTDENGNSSTATAAVTVLDQTSPTISLKNSITLDLNSNGEGTLTASNVGSSRDNCGIASFTLSKSQFTCEDIGVVEVVVTATDLSGNSTTGVALVTVRDRSNPVFVDLPKSISLTMPDGEPYEIPDFSKYVNDNCGISSYTQSIAAGTIVTTAGTYNMTINVGDASGNTARATVRIVRSAPRIRRNGARLDFQISELVKVPWNTPLEEVLSGLVWEESLTLSWVEDSYDRLTPGVYQVKALSTPQFQDLFDSPPVLNIIVLDKPKALDVKLSSNSFSNKLMAGDQIALLSTIDPVDDIHTYQIEGNPDLVVDGNRLIWKGIGMPEAEIKFTVFSTDRAGQTISKEIMLFRELKIGEFLIYPNPAEDTTKVLVELDQPSQVSLSVFDAVGRNVISDQFTRESTFVHMLDINGLAPGMYTVQIQVGKIVMTGRLIKK